MKNATATHHVARQLIAIGLALAAALVFNPAPAFGDGFATAPPSNADPVVDLVAEPARPEETTDTNPSESPAETPVPETTVPETTVPETTVPETTGPGTTVPATTVAPTSAPARQSEPASLAAASETTSPPQPLTTEGTTAPAALWPTPTTSDPFICSDIAWTVQGTNGRITTWDLTTSPFQFTTIATLGFTGNSLAYNVNDGLLYLTRGNQHIYTVDAAGVITDLGIPTEATTGTPLPSGGTFNAGSFGPDNTYYIVDASVRRLYRIDVTTGTYTVVQMDSLLGAWDFAYDPATGLLTTVENGSRVLRTIDPNTGAVTRTTLSGSATGANGAVIMDSAGVLYPYSNPGRLYRVDPPLTSGTLTQISTGASSDYNDGASCAFGAKAFKTVSPTTVKVGDSITYTFDLYWQGPAISTATFSDTLSFGGVYDPTSLTVDGVPTTTPLGGTATFNGNQMTLSDLNLTTGSHYTITVDVDIPAGATIGAVDNQATVDGLGGNIAAVPTDFPSTSDVGDPTPLTIIAVPLVGVSKSAGTPIANGDGTYNVPYTIVVENTGGTVLNNLTLTDDIAGQIGAAFVAVVGDPIVTSSAAAPPAANTAYDPAGTGSLISATGASLQPGESYTVEIVVTIDPAQVTGTATNQATAGGTDPATSLTAVDLSDSGTDPATGNPGAPGDTVDPTTGESGVDDPTPVVIPALGLSKDLSAVAPAASGAVDNLDVTYTMTVTNPGTVELTNLNLVDDIASQLGAAFVSVTAAPTVTANTASNAATAATAYDGTDTLSTATALAPGESFTISVTVEVDPNADPATLPLANQATVTADWIDSNGTTSSISDDSDAGTDPVGNNGSGGTDDPTALAIPQIGVAKSAGAPVANPDGTFDIGYTFVVKNTGSVDLTDLSLTDDMESQFGAGSIIGVAVSPTVSGISGGNAAFTADATDPELLDGSGVLSPGQSFTVTVTVTIDPALATLPLENQATAAGVDVDDPTSSATDLSDDGSNPESTNGSGGPNDPTALSSPGVGLAKSIIDVAPSATSYGDLDATYRMVLSNTGLEPVGAISLTDDLASQLGSAYVGVVGSPTVVSSDATGGVTANTNYMTAGDIELLSAVGAQLPAGGSIVVEVVVQINPDALGSPEPLTNQAAVSVVGSTTGDPASDLSDSGTDPTGTNTGQPGDSGGPDDPTPIAAGLLSVTKAVTDVVPSATAGHFDVTYTLSVQNIGNEALGNVGLTDDLDATFGSALVAVNSTALDTTGVTATPAPAPNANPYDGVANTELLDRSGSLAVGDRLAVTIIVEIDPSAGDGTTFDNQATATGTAPDGSPVTDLSDSGLDPLTTNEGQPGSTPSGADDPTPLQFPDISLAKSATIIGPAATPGNVLVEFALVVANTGSVTLAPLGLTDDLSTQLGAAFVAVDSAPVIDASSATADPTLGSGNPDLFTGTDGALAPGQSITVKMVVEIDPTADLTNLPLTNQATATGDYLDLDGNGQTTTDLSDSGTDPNSGNPDAPGATIDPVTGEPGVDDPTPIAVALIGVAKEVSGTPTPAASGNVGNYDVTYSFVVSNLGNEVLTGIGLADDWTTELGGAFVDVVASPQITASTATSDPTPATGNPNLFAGTDGELGPGQTITVTMTVELNPDAAGAALPLANQATVQGTDQYGTVATDASDSGTDPAGPNDAAPGATAGSSDDPTPVYLPAIAVAKSAGSPTATANPGEFSVDYTMVVRNVGSEPLAGLSLVDDLATQLGDAFGSASVATVTNIDADVAPGPNAGFDGATDPELLDLTGTLQPGQSFTVAVTVLLTPFSGTATFPLTNQATATGTWTNPDDGTTANVWDLSDSGAEAGGDNGDGGTMDPTAIINPAIRVAKSVAEVAPNNDGTSTITYRYVLQNYGFVDLYGVTLTDDIVDQLGGSSVVVSVATPVLVEQPANTVMTANSAFDGTATDPNLIVDASAAGQLNGLAPGATVTVTVDVVVDPTAAVSALLNQATATGTDATDITATDLSDSGTDTASSNTGAPNDSGGTDDPTPLYLPGISVSKAVATTSPTPTPGVFDVTYSLIVANTGSETLSSLSLTEDLAAVFGAALVGTPVVTVTNIDADAAPSANTGYDGSADTELLDGSGTFAPSQSFAVGLTVTVDANGATALLPFENSVGASGDWTDLDGGVHSVADVSDSGTDPTTSNDGAPGATPGNTADPTPLALPALSLAKSVSASVPHPGGPIGHYDVTYRFEIANVGSQTIAELTLTDDLVAQLGAGYVSTLDGPTVINETVDPPADLPSAGTGVPDLLGGDGSIDPGETFAVELQVEVDATKLTSDVTNTATVAGVDPTDPTATSVVDTSDSGTDPATGNPNAAGNTTDPLTGEPDTDDPTPLVVGGISVVKAATVVGPSSLGDPSHFDVRFDYVVANTGNQDLTNLSLVDDLSSQLGAAFVGVPLPVSVASVSGPNTAFDGSADPELLDRSGVLAPGQSFAASVLVEVDPDAGDLPLLNQALATGDWTDPYGNSGTADDQSDSGTDPMTANPGAPGNTTDPVTGQPSTTDPTPISISNIAVAKSVVDVVNPSASGTYGNVDVRYQLVVTNNGSEPLTGVELTDDIASQLTDTFVGVVTGPTITSETLAVDPVAVSDYDGTASLATAAEMQPAESFTVEFVIEIDPDATPIHVGDTNQATVTGIDPSDATVTDVSDTGTDPNSTNPGVPGDTTGADDPTPLLVPAVTLAKSSSVVGPASSGTAGNYDVTFTYQVANIGNVALLSPNLTDDFATEFGAAFAGVVDPGVTVDAVGVPNPNFDGSTDTSLLSDVYLSMIEPGETFTVAVTVEVDPAAATPPLDNQAAVDATWVDPAGNFDTVSDLSDSGTDATTTNETAPGATTDGGDDPTPLEVPVLAVAKTVEAVVPASGGAPGNVDVTYRFAVVNTGTVALEGVDLVDDLATQLGSAFVAVTEGPAVVSSTADIAPNPDATYAGVDTLATGATLQPRQGYTVDVVVEVDPDAGTPVLTNQATVTAPDPTDPTGPPVTDRSDSGTDPATGNPGAPGDTIDPTTGDSGIDDPTPLVVPQIALSKSSALVGPAASGAAEHYDVEFTVTVTNVGNIELDNLSVTDDLATQLGDSFVAVTVPPAVSAVSAPNPSFDGSGDPELVDGSGTLALGASFEITFTAEIAPFAVPPPLENQATGTGDWIDADENSGTVSDQSDSGTDPTTSNPDAPGATAGGTDDPTPVSIGVLGVAKSVVSVADPAASGRIGNVDVTYSFAVRNNGNVDLADVSLVDDLATQLGSAFVSVSGSPQLASSTATMNPFENAAYDGSDELAGGGILAPGEQFVVEVTVEIDPDAASGTLFNQAMATGTDPLGEPVMDMSDSGTDPNTGNPGQPGDTVDPTSGISGAQDPTPLTVPSIGVAKSANLIGAAASGTVGNYDIEYSFVVANTGNVDLANLSLSDDLAGQLGGVFVKVVSAPEVGSISGGNDGFDGGTDAELLDRSGVLVPGDSFTVTVVVEVDPSAGSIPITNQANATGDWDDGYGNTGTATDLSDSGTDPTAGNPNAPGNTTDSGGNASPDDPTPLSIPSIAIAKAVGGTTVQAGDDIDVTFRLKLTNTGTVALASVSVVDDLATQFGAAFVEVVSTSSADLTVNSDFDGDRDPELLAAGNTLAAGDSASITMIVRVNPDAASAPNPLLNQATASGVDQDDPTASTTDDSDSGTDPTAPNDSAPGATPGGVDDPTPVRLGSLSVDKKFVSNVDDGGGRQTLTYRVTVTNTGNSELSDVAAYDDIRSEFESAGLVSGTATATNGSGKANPAWDGSATSNLFAAGQRLPVGASVDVTLSFTIAPTATKAYTNTVSATATGPNGPLKPETASATTQITSPLGSISGTAFLDLNGDGVQDSDDPGLAGIKITLTDADGKVVATTTSGPDGTYRFDDLTPGQYTVIESQPDGFGSSTPSTVPVNLAPGGDAEASFGDTGGSISGRLWIDVDNDGIYDSNESPAPSGTVVKLYDGDGNLVATTTSDADGRYVFSGLPAGTYTVEVEPPDGYVFTIQSDSAAGSDLGQATGTSGPISVGLDGCTDGAQAGCGLATEEVDGGIVDAVISVGADVDVPTKIAIGTDGVIVFTPTNDSNVELKDGVTFTVKVPPCASVVSVDAPGYEVTIVDGVVTLVWPKPLAPGEDPPPFKITARGVSVDSACQIDATVQVNGVDLPPAKIEIAAVPIPARTLPKTGGDLGGTLAFAALTVALGAALVIGARRRNRRPAAM